MKVIDDTNIAQQGFVSLAQQNMFTHLCGDHNPIHVDAHYARRVMIGNIVVHGIHTLLWSLDCLAHKLAKPVRIQSLNVIFQASYTLDETIACAIDCNDLHATLCVQRGTTTIMTAQLQLFADERYSQPNIMNKCPPLETPLKLTNDDISTQHGNIELCLDRQACHALFPHATATLPPEQLAFLLGCTRIVGMKCPGWDSIFSSLNCTFLNANNDLPNEKTIHYQVKHFDTRFSRITMDVCSDFCRSEICAFHRPAPQQQPTIAEIVTRVTTGEFKHQRALVIGGSRGLGEITAKILAAGGAQVTITYCNGETDAARVVNECQHVGLAMQMIPFDVCDAIKNIKNHLAAQLAATHLYYFATPTITLGQRGQFDTELYQRFCCFYVDGFINTVLALCGNDAALRVVFYPSTIFLDHRPNDGAEYIAAKAEGEALCKFLASHYKLHVLAPRLPRLATDQTASIYRIQKEDTLTTMLDAIRMEKP